MPEFLRTDNYLGEDVGICLVAAISECVWFFHTRVQQDGLPTKSLFEMFKGCLPGNVKVLLHCSVLLCVVWLTLFQVIVAYLALKYNALSNEDTF